MFKAVFSRLIAATVILLAIPVAASLLNRVAPPFDSIAQFRMHLATALAIAALLAAFSGAQRSSLIGGLTVLAALAFTWPYLPGFSPGAGSGAIAMSRTVRVLQFNTLYNNSQTDLAARIIRAAGPDVVLLQEVTDGPKALINLLRDDYPVQLRCGNSRIGGATVISRLPKAKDEIECVESFALSAIRLDLDGTEMTFASYHAFWPWPFNQQEGIDKLAERLASLPHPLVITGDFNATPWSEGVQQIARLTDARPASGMRATWLTPHFPNGSKEWIGLPIDHVMVSNGLSITRTVTLPFAGSDHLPVVADIAY